MEALSALPTEGAPKADRSATLLTAGLHALHRGQLDEADRFLVALSREGSERDYRTLAAAFVRVAAR